MGAHPISQADRSRTSRLLEALSTALGEQDAREVLDVARWDAPTDAPSTAGLAPLAWADEALFRTLLKLTSLERADGLRREARSILLSTPAQPTNTPLASEPLVEAPTSGVRYTPAAARLPLAFDNDLERAPAGAASRPSAAEIARANREKDTRPPPTRAKGSAPARDRARAGRSTVSPVQSGGVVLWTDDEDLAETLEERVARDDEVLFRVSDIGELRRALIVFTGRSPLVVLDRRGLDDDELTELRPTELEGSAVVLFDAAHLTSPRVEAALSTARRVVSCSAEAGPAGVLDLCASLRSASGSRET